MKRNEIIIALENASPVITSYSFSDDMGYEFSAIVPGGVIYPQPGMLLTYSDGRWPPDNWKRISSIKYKQRIDQFLMEDNWSVTPWNKLSLRELKQWLSELEAL